MSNSGNTLSKKTITIIVIIAILLIAAIAAVVVFLRDQGQTSAMAENNPQSVAEEQNAEPEQQSTPEEQSAETPSTDDGAQIPTDVASVDDDATTEGTDNAGTTTTPATTGTTGGTATTGDTQNAGTTTTTDANNIQESVIEETQTTYDEERVKVEEGKILSWTPEAPLTVLVGMANNMKLNAPKLVIDKTSVVVNKDGTEAEDQTKVDLTQKIKYTVTIENLGNVAGVIEATDTFDVIPEGLDLSSATDLSAILTDAE